MTPQRHSRARPGKERPVGHLAGLRLEGLGELNGAGYRTSHEVLSFAPSPMKELLEIAKLRSEGARYLEAIAEQDGADSILFRCCRELWMKQEVGADLSILSGDFRNAITLLEHGLNVLVHGPDVLRKEGLPLGEVMSLLGSAS